MKWKLKSGSFPGFSIKRSLPSLHCLPVVVRTKCTLKIFTLFAWDTKARGLYCKQFHLKMIYYIPFQKVPNVLLDKVRGGANWMNQVFIFGVSEYVRSDLGPLIDSQIPLSINFTSPQPKFGNPQELRKLLFWPLPETNVAELYFLVFTNDLRSESS